MSHEIMRRPARVIVSACLLGDNVRYHGGNARCSDPVLEQWLVEGRVIPFCPEVAGGLPVPRPAAEIEPKVTGLEVWQGCGRVLTSGGVDVTAGFREGARRAVELARKHGVRVAVLKEGSPSCAVMSTYDGTFGGNRTPSMGVTAAALVDAGVEVFNEDHFDDAATALSKFERGHGP